MAKTLAERQQGVILSLVHIDEAGFMPNRATRHNIRRLHNALALTYRLQTPAAIFLADMEKAFDSVSWVYLFILLQRLNFGPKFIKYIQVLYTHLLTTVRIGGEISENFSVQRSPGF